MSDQITGELQSIDLTTVIPNAIGLLAFDENKNVIDSSGVGKERLDDVNELSNIETNSEGFALLSEKNIKVYIYKQEGKTVVVYAYEKV
ncbi:DUF3215 domain-containing protein SCDLUD_003748 [Saccharomycodes ludwigii]|uniref:DUF3215 domain-containing protein n=1 Tax=Saccharomycodes ludwigii TaxID=36035 RepID=UPI001E8870FF|nr:hypothetical protein SCDLUD_003748 [Saccharomycodes ludwigii]KAH3900743.1 hypothetical protein SCDLUD_003748 [Saccharomycodes ludwigii]